MQTLIESRSANEAVRGGRFLIFELGGELYGMDVLKVRGIIHLLAITAVPQMPAHIRGVINLRGSIIPVMDLRLRLGLPDAASGDHSCIIVVQVGGLENTRQMGLVVDAVEEVLNISATDIETPPDCGRNIDGDFILQLAKSKGRVVVLLNAERVVGSAITAAEEHNF